MSQTCLPDLAFRVGRLAYVPLVQSPADQPQWWEMVGGILAIPAAILGLAYSIILIRKARLEARKTELEIQEKEQALKKLAEESPEAARQIMIPIVEGRQAQYLILRFVLLYVVVELWGFVGSVFNFLTGGAFLGIQELTPITTGVDWAVIVFYVVSNIPSIVRWIIIVGIGWPLFRDLNAFLKVDIRSIVFPWTKDRSESG